MAGRQRKVVQILYSGLGGHGSVAFSLIEAEIQQSGIKNHLIFYGIEEVKPEYTEKCRQLNIPFYCIKKKPGLDFRSFIRVMRIIRKMKPDVILLHSIGLIPFVFLATLFTGTKVVVVEHQSNQLKTRWDWIYSFFSMLLARKVVYLTEVYAAEIKDKLGMWYRRKKVTVIPNGIDTHYFAPAPKSKENLILKLGMISRLNAIKDHSSLIAAFAIVKKSNSHPGLQLLIAGDGDTLEGLKREVIDFDISEAVLFTGMLNEEEVLHLLHGLTIYIHSSFGETMSTSIMQAMSCGLPVIATNVQGVNNMLQHNQTGILVPAKNKVVMAAAINKILADEEFRERLSVNARNYATAHFSNQVMFQNYVRCMDQLDHPQ